MGFARIRSFKLAGVTLGLGMALTLVLAACGGAGSGSSPYGSGGSSNPTATTGSTGGGYGGYGTPVPTATTSSGPAAGVTCSSSSAIVCTKQVMVNGAQTTVLSTPAGKTIYYFKPDSATTSQCTGGCASAWPPVTGPAGASLGSEGLPGTLAVVSDGNTNQVTYQGHPLYTYSGDQSVSDATGEGIDNGNWQVATPSLTSQGGSSGGGGYGGW
ncbi:MAG TPA: hypothetical protein VKQ36_07095 [Ktedonobacterales bacterium]|nr:hypothetical protein [Ktedonobacterales bacterium]